MTKSMVNVCRNSETKSFEVLSSYNDFINTYKIQINPLKYYGIISALNHLYKHTNRPNEPDDLATPEPFLELFLNSLKGNRAV